MLRQALNQEGISTRLARQRGELIVRLSWDNTSTDCQVWGRTITHSPIAYTHLRVLQAKYVRYNTCSSTYDVCQWCVVPPRRMRTYKLLYCICSDPPFGVVTGQAGHIKPDGKSVLSRSGLCDMGTRRGSWLSDMCCQFCKVCEGFAELPCPFS